MNAQPTTEPCHCTCARTHGWQQQRSCLNGAPVVAPQALCQAEKMHACMQASTPPTRWPCVMWQGQEGAKGATMIQCAAATNPSSLSRMLHEVQVCAERRGRATRALGQSQKRRMCTARDVAGQQAKPSPGPPRTTQYPPPDMRMHTDDASH